MEIRDWIMLASASLVVLGWFMNSYLNRRHEKAKKRMDYRLEALHSFLPVWFTIQKIPNPFEKDPRFLEKLEKSRSNFLLYGYQDEINYMEAFIKAIEAQNVSEANKALQKLVPLVKNRVRDELGFSG